MTKQQYPKFEQGDRIAYRAAFLRSIGDYSHASASRRGVVLNAHPAAWSHLLDVQWDDGSSSPVNAANVLLADRVHLEPA
jgi:hypothetical protein